MSIIKYTSNGEYPTEGQMVFADNGDRIPDRCIYKNGTFWGGDEFPMRKYEMGNVYRWFDFDEYIRKYEQKHQTKSCRISFKEAEGLD